MFLFPSLLSLVTGRRGPGRVQRVSWPRPAVEELESRWVPSAAPGVGTGAFTPGSAGGGFVPATFSSGQADQQTAALNPPVPNGGTATLNPAGTLGGTVTQNGVVTNPAFVAQSLILNRVPIEVSNQNVTLFGSLTGTVAGLPTVPGSRPIGVSNANPLLMARTARLSGSGNDFATVLATNSELLRRGIRDFIEALPGVEIYPPPPPPPPRLQTALPPSHQEQTRDADELVQSVQQQAPETNQVADTPNGEPVEGILDFLLQGGSLVELEALLSQAGE